jgi:sarcosine oxidase
VIDVVVVGGGAMGSAAAWRLARKGLDVALIERFEAGHTRGGSHGASRIYRLVYDDPLYIDLARRALAGWRELEAVSGASLLEVTGGVDHGDGLASLTAALAAAGVPFELLSPQAAAQRWPGLRFEQAGSLDASRPRPSPSVDRQVLFQPDAGCLDADRTVAALQAAARALGASVDHNRRALAVRVRGDDRIEVDTVDGTVVARRAVVAIGAWAGKLLDGLIDLPRLTVTQEQPAYFTPTMQAAWPTFIHRHERSAYGLFTPGAGVKIGFHHGGPVCDPDERDFTPDAESHRRLVEYVGEWVPGADPTAPRLTSCLYDTTDSEDFVIDRLGPLTVATGFSGHGFKFVPEIGRMLADLAWDGTPAPARFALPATRRSAPSGSPPRFAQPRLPGQEGGLPPARQPAG